MHNCGLEENRQRSAPQVAVVEKQSKVPLPSSDPAMYTVYGENWCGWTSKARTLLRNRQIPFKYHTLGDDRHDFARQYANGHRTIPMVFLGERFLGGYDALYNELESQ